MDEKFKNKIEKDRNYISKNSIDDYNNYFSNYVSEFNSEKSLKNNFQIDNIFNVQRKNSGDNEHTLDNTIEEPCQQRDTNKFMSMKSSPFESFKDSKFSYDNNSNFAKILNTTQCSKTDIYTGRTTVDTSTELTPVSNCFKKMESDCDQPEFAERSPVLKINLKVCEKDNCVDLMTKSNPEILASERIRQIVETVRRERSKVSTKIEPKTKLVQVKEHGTRRKLFTNNFDKSRLSPDSAFSKTTLDQNKENMDVNLSSKQSTAGKTSCSNLTNIYVNRVKIFNEVETPKQSQSQNYNTLETYSHITDSKLETPFSSIEKVSNFGIESPNFKREELHYNSKNCERYSSSGAQSKEYSYESSQDPIKFYISGEFLTPLKDMSQSRNGSFLRYTSFGIDGENNKAKGVISKKISPEMNTEIEYRTDETMEFNFKKKSKINYNESLETERENRSSDVLPAPELRRKIKIENLKVKATRGEFKEGLKIHCSSLYKISFLSFMKQLMKARNTFINFELEIAVQHYSENLKFKEQLIRFFHSKEIMNSTITRSKMTWTKSENFWLTKFASNLKIDRLAKFQSDIKRTELFSWMTQVDQASSKSRFTIVNNRSRKVLMTSKNLPMNAKKIHAVFVKNKHIKSRLRTRDNTNTGSVRPCLFFLNGQAKHIHYYDLFKRKHANVFTPNFNKEEASASKCKPMRSLIENYKIYQNYCVLSSGRDIVLIRLNDFKEIGGFRSSTKIMTVFFVSESRFMVIPEVGQKVEFYNFVRGVKDVLILSKRIPRGNLLFNFEPLADVRNIGGINVLPANRLYIVTDDYRVTEINLKLEMMKLS